MRGEGIAKAVVQLTLMELSNVSCEGMRSLRIFAGAVPDFLSNSSSAQLQNLVGTFCDPISSSGGEEGDHPGVVIESGASGGQLAVLLDAPSATFKERENGGERDGRRHHAALADLHFRRCNRNTCWCNRIRHWK